MTIAPWLIPPNFLEAAQAGAQIGLAQRRQAEEAADALRRNALGYAQLAAENQRSSNELEAKKASAEQSQANEDRRMGLAEKQLTATESNRDAVNALRERGLNLQEDRQDKSSDKPFMVKLITGGNSFEPEKTEVPSDKFWNFYNQLDPKWRTNQFNINQSKLVPMPAQTTNSPVASLSAPRSTFSPMASPMGTSSFGTPKNPSSSLDLSDLRATTSDLSSIPSVYPPPEAVLPKFKAGQRAVQGGVTYEFDGNNWNEVKQ